MACFWKCTNNSDVNGYTSVTKLNHGTDFPDKTSIRFQVIWNCGASVQSCVWTAQLGLEAYTLYRINEKNTHNLKVETLCEMQNVKTEYSD